MVRLRMACPRRAGDTLPVLAWGQGGIGACDGGGTAPGARESEHAKKKTKLAISSTSPLPPSLVFLQGAHVLTLLLSLFNAAAALAELAVVVRPNTRLASTVRLEAAMDGAVLALGKLRPWKTL